MKKIAVVARFKPLHLVHAALLETLAELGDELLVGVGSANRYDARNPFTCDETAAMVDAVLGPRGARYRVVAVPDLGNGPRWARMVAELLGPVDLFVTANAWVAELLAPVYPLAHPRDLVPRARHAPIDGRGVRRALARGEAWRGMVPPAVVELMDRLGLPERFRREFGLETLVRDAEAALAPGRDPVEEEMRHVLLG